MTAELGLGVAVHEELVAMCQNIITTQSEIEMMQAWLVIGMASPMSRAEFEIAFMEMPCAASS